MILRRNISRKKGKYSVVLVLERSLFCVNPPTYRQAAESQLFRLILFVLSVVRLFTFVYLSRQ